MRPVATVAIPTYNAVTTVLECLQSIEKQSFPREHLQVIVGDNGSTDGTREIIVQHFPWVKVVVAPERGSGHARNAAIRHAHGRYLLSIDADCVADVNWVTAMINAFESAPANVVALGGQFLPFSTRTVAERFRPAWPQQSSLRDNAPGIRYAEAGNAAFRLSLFDLIGYFDASSHDDADMGIRITLAGYDIRYVAEAIVQHRNPQTVRELYRHRVKYGVLTTKLAHRFPAMMYNPCCPEFYRALQYGTLRRVAGDLVYKFPWALLSGAGEKGTRLWPLLDALMALGNYQGSRRAIKELTRTGEQDNCNRRTV